MGSYTVIVISVIMALGMELVSCSSEERGGGGGVDIPRSNSGRPFGVDITDDFEVFPHYDSGKDVVGVGFEARPNSKTVVRGTGGVSGSGLLRGKIERPQGELEMETRINENFRLILGAGVDGNGNPRAHVGVHIEFRRRRSANSAPILNEETSRMLFSVFDLNQDGKLDVIDWSTEGGKLLSFSDLIVAHDLDGDEKLSLDEFLAVPIMPDLGLGLALGWDDDMEGDDDSPTYSPSPAQDED